MLCVCVQEQKRRGEEERKKERKKKEADVNLPNWRDTFRHTFLPFAVSDSPSWPLQYGGRPTQRRRVTFSAAIQKKNEVGRDRQQHPCRNPNVSSSKEIYRLYVLYLAYLSKYGLNPTFCLSNEDLCVAAYSLTVAAQRPDRVNSQNKGGAFSPPGDWLGHDDNKMAR